MDLKPGLKEPTDSMADYGDRIIQGFMEGSCYPIEDVDFERTLVLGKDFDVKGGLYAKNLKITGRGEVHGPIFVRSETILQGIDSTLKARGGLISVGSLKTEETGLKAAETTVCRAGGERILSGGDLISEYVFLENSLVVGSVQAAQQVHLKNCLVIGPVFSKGNLHLTNSTVLTYHAQNVEFSGKNTILLPVGFSKEKPIFDHPQDPADALVTRLRYLGLCSSLGLSPFQKGAIRHDPAMEHELDQQVCIDEDADLQPCDTAQWGSGWALNLSARALNWKPIKESIENLGSMVEAFYRWEHFAEPLRVDLINAFRAYPELSSLLETVAPALDPRLAPTGNGASESTLDPVGAEFNEDKLS